MSKNGHVVTHFDPAKASSNQNRGLKTAPKNSASVRLDGNIARRAVRGSEFFWWDTDLPGFGLRTFPGGAKSWFVQFRQRGKQKRVTLGRPGEMSAIDARTAARSHLANVALDGLPAMPKASRKANATIRFGDYAPRFWEDYSRHWKPSTAKETTILSSRNWSRSSDISGWTQSGAPTFSAGGIVAWSGEEPSTGPYPLCPS
jgi:hypothetical protein